MIQPTPATITTGVSRPLPDSFTQIVILWCNKHVSTRRPVLPGNMRLVEGRKGPGRRAIRR